MWAYKLLILCSVKPKQLEDLENILRRNDTLGILPTNYGKSMIYQLLPAVCTLLPGQPNNAIVIVFSPLNALIENQIDEANKLSKALNLKATTLDGSYQHICAGKFNIIIDTPEAWLSGSRWKGGKICYPLNYFVKMLCVLWLTRLTKWNGAHHHHEMDKLFEKLLHALVK